MGVIPDRVPSPGRETTIKFDELFESAVPLISSGDHERDTPPVEGGRWPVSVVLRPPAGSALSHRLDQLTAEAADIPAPEDLIAWVKTHRSVSLGETTVETAELVQFHHVPGGDRPLMRPQVIASASLGA